jgi:hypothetical protein
MDNSKDRRTNDRRKFNYTAYFPERRAGQERRVNMARRADSTNNHNLKVASGL